MSVIKRYAESLTQLTPTEFELEVCKAAFDDVLPAILNRASQGEL